MKSAGRRRGGWNYEAPPIPKSTRVQIHERNGRRYSIPRKFAVGLLTVLVAMLLIAACLVALQRMNFRQIIVPEALTRINRFIPLHAPASSSVATPLPSVHNSTDTECDNHRQCTDDEFAGLVDSLRRQWAITPEELRSKCAVDSTYPSLEHCILTETVPWLDKHPNGAVPWINPKNFDAAIMALCQKDPTSLPLCTKP
ncbi:MAG TPA: YSIRK-type signal peptide-containing protein [Acidobacteriaceae bacterium]|nr:YSIRK-type signal peptide-containing protein [Acidobacteriaceae bacterium]